MTKEHIWPRWLHKVLAAPEPVDVAVVTRPRTLGAHGFTEVRHLLRSGSRLTRQMRRVCGSCNGGWMSRLQMAARPIVEPLVRGQRTSLSPHDQAVLAAWTTMTAMVGEYTDPESVGATTEERRALMEDLKPPPSWRIWIASYDGELGPPLYAHDSFASHPPPGEPLRLNGHATTLAIGRLFIYAASLPEPRLLELFSNGLDGVLTPIPGRVESTLLAPLRPLLDEADFHEFKDLMRQFLGSRSPLAPLPDDARPER